MADKTTPDLDTFLKDPQFQGDRDLFKGFYKHLRAEEIAEEKKAAEEQAKKDAEEAAKNKGAFSLFPRFDK